jgi:hypothetical protein
MIIKVKNISQLITILQPAPLRRAVAIRRTAVLYRGASPPIFAPPEKDLYVVILDMPHVTHIDSGLSIWSGRQAPCSGGYRGPEFIPEWWSSLRADAAGRQ